MRSAKGGIAPELGLKVLYYRSGAQTSNFDWKRCSSPAQECHFCKRQQIACTVMLLQAMLYLPNTPVCCNIWPARDYTGQAG